MTQSLPKPNYTVWQAVSAALAASLRALDEIRALSRLPGPPGERGLPGRDGFVPKEMSITSPDGGRTLVFTYKRDAEINVQEVKTDMVLDRGVWREGTFAKGDGVTWGGSFWIAQADTTSKPESNNSEWRLAVKRGRDGKDGKNGERGIEGKPGRDLSPKY